MKSIDPTHSRSALVALATLCTGLLATAASARDEDTRRTGSALRGGYIGSAECAGCHTQTYQDWWATRHAYSVKSADEARDAGYPLPSEEGRPGTINAWSDVSYVIGGRQRIAYADRAGRVMDSAYHNRIGKWSVFPSKSMEDCGPCHYTGFGVGAPHPDDPALPSPYIERNVGCESCHGPGAAHAESLEPEDIVVDASSRVCGGCHTSVGKILPKDDLHGTHDLVQTWNRDPHVTGVQFHSHNAFCSDCHSPYERGAFSDRTEGAETRVFSEAKQNVTCIGCHNPHALTDSNYVREEVNLRPPLAPQRQVYRGNDDDFTTTDFDEFESTEQVCLDCHRGADRVDLDHANASCNDCHNTFNRNRQPESRPFHDANYQRLSCRPCHQNADHLISIVYRDEDFLEPRHLHNLRTLPKKVIARYEFKYPALRPTRRAALNADPGGLRDKEEKPASVVRTDKVREGVIETTDSLSNQLARAQGFTARGEYAEALDILGQLGRGDSTGYRSLLFAAGLGRPALSTGDPVWTVPEPGASGSPNAIEVQWLDSLHDLAKGQFEAAVNGFTRALVLERSASGVEPFNPDTAPDPTPDTVAGTETSLALHLGLAQLGARRIGDAIETLESVVEARPSHIASRIALAAIYINHDRLGLAQAHLELAMAVDPQHGLAAYFFGRTLLRVRKPVEAAEAFRTVLAVRPEDLDARFHLARAFRSGGFYGSAVDTYQEIIRRKPGLFAAHYDLALLYKTLSDKAAMTYKRQSEQARPVGTGLREWQQYLSQLEEHTREYGELALAKFGRAEEIRPLEADGVRQIGEIFRRSGRFGEARKKFERLVRIEPTRWEHRYRLGTIAIRSGEYDDAIDLLTGALELAPTEGDIHIALALAYEGSGRADDALDTLERGAVHEAFNPALYTNLGAAYGRRGDHESARRSLERALKLRTFPLPRSHLAHLNLGILHLREGRRAEAIQSFESALHVFPDYTYARRLLTGMTSDDAIATGSVELVYDDLLERFGETSTVQFADELK
jgi:tetratricopeptide (TPR) repeat protein